VLASAVPLAVAVAAVEALDERVTPGATVLDVELAAVADGGAVVFELLLLAGSTVEVVVVLVVVLAVVLAVAVLVVVLLPAAGAMEKAVENTLGAVKSFWF
jgi:hypothetical protein